MPLALIERLESRQLFAVSPLPDLTIGIGPPPSHIQEGARTGIGVQVKNVGNAMAEGTVDIQLTANGTTLADQPVKLRLKPGKFKNLKIYYQLPDPGGPAVVTAYETVTTTVDSGNAIAEQDETNNSWQDDNVPLWNLAFRRWNSNRPKPGGPPSWPF